MDRQEIERKIIELARKVAESETSDWRARLAGRLDYLFEQLDALAKQEVKR
jgi:tRNA(Ser,Leu) C12 N-acetylase TAN1